jgi:putative transposase
VPTQPIDLLRDPARDDAQMDFSVFETARGGIWRICAVIDYATSTAWSVLALLAVVVTSTAAPAAATAA